MLDNLTREQLEEMLFAITYSAVSHTEEMLYKGKKARARQTLKVINEAAQTMDFKAVRALIKKGEE
jgi:hypothetical protein